MKMSDDGRAKLIELEGSRAKAYKDVVGLLTIGVGHLITKSELLSGKLYIAGEAIKWADGLSAEQIDSLLAQDLKPTEEIVSTACPNMEQGQLDALVSFTFNTGVNAFLNSTLLKFIRAGRMDEVPAQFRRWIRAGGRVIPGLATRREVEVSMWLGQ